MQGPNCQRCEKLEVKIERLGREVERLSTDPVTGLSGRSVFDHMIRLEFARAKRTDAALGVMMLDLDHFKRVNDTLGHLEGDKALARVGRVIRASVRGSDTAARYGGEEFVILVGATSPAGLQVLAERIRRRVERVGLATDPAPYTVSIGCAWLLPDDKEYVQIVGRADAALYRAKASGRNRTCMEKSST